MSSWKDASFPESRYCRRKAELLRTPYIAGNWKMHKTISESVNFATELKKRLAGAPNRLLVAPPFTALSAVADVLRGSNIGVGAQNMASASEGAHTGEVSPLMLREAGASAVIIGHSERRSLYGETDELINAKIHLAIAHELEVIFCVGETLEEREAGKVNDVVGLQLTAGLDAIDATAMGSVTIAYEPVWAIGTGRTASPDDAQAVHAMIRALVSQRWSPETADRLIIQYGGSVKPGNVDQLISMPDIDGALVGGASLAADSFAPIALVGSGGS